MRLLTLAEIDQMPLVPGTCDLCGRNTQVYALSVWTCRPRLLEDMEYGDVDGGGAKARDRRPGEGHETLGTGASHVSWPIRRVLSQAVRGSQVSWPAQVRGLATGQLN
jgi:hypothetical protein